MSEPSLRDRLLGGLWGAVVGDALGVPVECCRRAELRQCPVTNLRAYGTHNQPKGTWSDDSSLMLCTVDSLLRQEFDTADMGQRFVEWAQGRLWTPWGSVFDIGISTRTALSLIEGGSPAELAGGAHERSNGNGSLMRILPIALRFGHEAAERLLQYAYRADVPPSERGFLIKSHVLTGFLCL